MTFNYRKSMCQILILLFLFYGKINQIWALDDIPENSCGIISLVICLHLLDIPVDTDEIIQNNPVQDYGANISELISIASSYKCHCIAIKTDSTSLLKTISNAKPAIVHSTMAEHFYVTIGYNDAGNKVVLFEPTHLHRLEVPLNVFSKLFDGRALIISKDPIKFQQSIKFYIIIIAFLFFSLIYFCILIFSRKHKFNLPNIIM